MSALFDLTGRTLISAAVSAKAALLAGQGAHVIVSSRRAEGRQAVADNASAAKATVKTAKQPRIH
jgi:hypothetical protein